MRPSRSPSVEQQSDHLRLPVGDAGFINTVGRDSNGLIIATAQTGLADGFYNVRVSYKYTQVLSLLFNK